jgi:hypothetical protein
MIALMLEYGWFALEVIGASFLLIALALWINWLRLGKPSPPRDFR